MPTSDHPHQQSAAGEDGFLHDGQLLRVAVPSKGALSEGALRLLAESGYRCERRNKELQVIDRANGVEFTFLRPKDIATYVGRGTIDAGITGRDLWLDSGATVTELLALGFGRSGFYLAGAIGDEIDLFTDPPPRIATSYDHLLRKHLDEIGSKAEIVLLDGSVEVAPALGVADLVADVVQSGRTLREAGLQRSGEPIMRSEAILIARDAEQVAASPGIRRLLSRLEGAVLAHQYRLVDYDIPSELLEQASALTPGIESPTVSPLSRPDWVAVRSMVASRDIHKVIDRLSDLGARAILVSDIRSYRR